MKDLKKFFTITIKGEKFIPTLKDIIYGYKLHYGINTYTLIKDDYTEEAWKIIRRDIKEDLYRTIKRNEIAAKRKELFGV